MIRHVIPVGLADRMWSKFERDQNGCWIWTGARSSNRYGAITVDRRLVGAHRAMYELIVGPIPEGMFIDHLCRVTLCVNPAHLEVVTPKENSRRSLFVALKTHCAQGHPWIPENTFRNNQGRNHCRICANERRRARYWACGR